MLPRTSISGLKTRISISTSSVTSRAATCPYPRYAYLLHFVILLVAVLQTLILSGLLYFAGSNLVISGGIRMAFWIRIR